VKNTCYKNTWHFLKSGSNEFSYNQVCKKFVPKKIYRGVCVKIMNGLGCFLEFKFY
jgi:hypothetical protein